MLGIELSPVPLQKNPEERCLYLVDICRKIEDFRVANSLTKPEVCALLYGYAPERVEYLESHNPQDTPDLPAPTRIWMTGASKEDWKAGLLEKDENVWAGNERTLRGDIVVIYALSPHSCIHSVWRAVDDGEANPFDYYVNRVAVGHRTDVPRITFKDLKADPAMSQVPMVRDNLQGINGKELSYQDYQSLLDMFAAKGFDIATLPNLEAPRLENDNKDILVEDDVSVKNSSPCSHCWGTATKTARIGLGNSCSRWVATAPPTRAVGSPVLTSPSSLASLHWSNRPLRFSSR